MFDVGLARYSDNICLISENNTLSYKDVDEICTILQKALPDNKQLILIKAKINIETIIGYLSFFRSSHACIILDSSVDDKLSQNIIDKYVPNYIWEEKNGAHEYIVDYGSYGLRMYNFRALSLHPDLSLMLSTSGTTGSPKMVKLTKKNLYANCRSIIEYLGIDQTHRAITNLPLHYSYGISVLNTHLEQGASIVVTDSSIMSKEFWKLFKKHNVTTLNGVPYNYEIFRRIGLMKMDLPSLKYMTQAGGKLNKKYVKEFATWAKKKDIFFYVMYGQTEATARISYLPTEKTLEKDTSIGISVPSGKLMIKDIDSDKMIEENYVDGELLYFGDNVMMGYATKLEDLANGDELQGVLHTGDIAHKDEEGYFYITGRLKRFIKIHGNRVGLDEIEQFLKSKSYDILCTGADNKLMIATLSEDSNEEIKREVINKYGFHHSVVKVQTVNGFPVTSAGKIKYQELIKAFS